MYDKKSNQFISLKEYLKEIYKGYGRREIARIKIENATHENNN